jgi:uncharacterized protein (DUF1501 family)
MTERHGSECGCSEYRELSRRHFIERTAGVGGAVAATAAFPAWLPRVVLAEQYQSSRDVIVSVFQRGGVDGLTTCVPFTDNNYYAARPTISIPRPDSSSPLRSTNLDGFFAFPPAMLGLLPAYAATDLLIVHAVGSLGVSRSHFDAMRWVEVGKPADATLVTGWLGRHLATVPPMRSNVVLRGIGIAPGLPRTLVGGPKTLPIENPVSYAASGAYYASTGQSALFASDYGATPDPVQTGALDAISTIELLTAVDFNGYVPANGAVYPDTPFGRALRAVAVLIKADVGIEAAQADIGGWDTHASQDPNTGPMRDLMADFSGSLGAFWQDVIATAYPVTLVSVSEFGRNLRENGSGGTDHGRAGTMFVMGKAIAGGRVLALNWPGLAIEQLEDQQDLRVTLDCRDILAELVATRLGNGSNLGVIFPEWTPTFRGVTR